MIKLSANVIMLHENMSTYGLNKFKSFMEMPEVGGYFEISGEQELSDWMVETLRGYGDVDVAIFAVDRNMTMYVGYSDFDDEAEEPEDEDVFPMKVMISKAEFNLDRFAMFDAEMNLYRYIIITEFAPGKWKLLN